MKDTKDSDRLVNDAPCRSCEGCTDPFECAKYLEWVFSPFKEVAETVWKGVNDKSQ